METFTANLISKISLIHLNMLFLLGLVLFGGTIGGRLFQKIKVPQVVGYIVIGILLGTSGIRVINEEIISNLQPISYFALGIIGLLIGGELKFEVLKKYGKQFIYILFSEGIASFLVVSVFVSFLASFILPDLTSAIAVGLLLGAISSATAPAATLDVLWELKTRGPLTTTVIGIVALDDALSLVLFSVASTLAASLIGMDQSNWTILMLQPFHEIGVSLLIGTVSGFALSFLLRRYSDDDRILQFSLGMIMLVLGFSLAIHVDMLISAMALGVVVTNFTPRKSKEVFKLIKGFAPPVFVLFFVMIGAKINVGRLDWVIGIISISYLFGRTTGKVLGSYLGAKISQAPKTVQKYLPFCLFSQAGVAVGLSIAVWQKFPGVIGDTVLISITLTTFIVQIIGPAIMKKAVEKSGEEGLDITEDDLIKNSRMSDYMDHEPPVILENQKLKEVLHLFSETDYLNFPVVNKENKLLGLLTIEEIKNTIMETSFDQFFLAHDMMEPVIKAVSPDTPMIEVKELFDRYHFDSIPVVDEEGRLLGILELKKLQVKLTTQIIELQRRADALV